MSGISESALAALRERDEEARSLNRFLVGGTCPCGHERVRVLYVKGVIAKEASETYASMGAAVTVECERCRKRCTQIQQGANEEDMYLTLCGECDDYFYDLEPNQYLCEPCRSA